MEDRFIDKGDGTVTDQLTGLIWMQKDSWLDLNKFTTYRQAAKYLKKKNQEAFAGNSDWRFPSKQEANTLYFRDKDKSIVDKYEIDIYIDPVFQKGCGYNTWTNQTRGSITAYVYSFASGTGGHTEVDDALETSVRLVRGQFDESKAAKFGKVPPKKGMIIMDRK